MEGGLCLENDEIMSMCITSLTDTEIGTIWAFIKKNIRWSRIVHFYNLGMKIADAMFSCSDSPTEMRKGKGKGKKGKGKGKGKGKSCPSVEDIANMAIEELSGK